MIILIFDEEDNEIPVKVYFNHWDELQYDETSYTPKERKAIEKHLRDYRQEVEAQLWKYIEEQTKGMADDC